MLGKLFSKVFEFFGNILFEYIPLWIDKLLNIFPHSPFTWISSSSFGDLIGKINYFVPVYDFITMLEAWLVAISVYYLYSIFARWLKAIE